MQRYALCCNSAACVFANPRSQLFLTVLLEQLGLWLQKTCPCCSSALLSLVRADCRVHVSYKDCLLEI